MLGGGLHLILDGETAVPLTAAKIERFLRHFPSLIGIHRITKPMVVEQEDGHCGIVVIAASHISVHTQGCHLWADIFSCVGFSKDSDMVGRAVARLLGLVQYRVQVVRRPMPPIVQELIPR